MKVADNLNYNKLEVADNLNCNNRATVIMIVIVNKIKLSSNVYNSLLRGRYLWGHATLLSTGVKRCVMTQSVFVLNNYNNKKTTLFILKNQSMSQETVISC